MLAFGVLSAMLWRLSAIQLVGIVGFVAVGVNHPGAATGDVPAED